MKLIVDTSTKKPFIKLVNDRYNTIDILTELTIAKKIVEDEIEKQIKILREEKTTGYNVVPKKKLV